MNMKETSVVQVKSIDRNDYQDYEDEKETISDKLLHELKLVAEEVQKLTKLNLFGVDIIISKDEDGISQFSVVDVNYFPSYKKVQDLPRI